MESSELAEVINKAHDELARIVPQNDMNLPGGERARAATYVHQHMKMMAAGLEGYGFEDSAIGEGQQKVANLSEMDRMAWIGSAHDAAAHGARWIAPHLSRQTNEYFQDRSKCEKALVHLPAPETTLAMSEDQEVIGVVMESNNRRYIVPLGNPDSGEIRDARPLAGMGAGLINGADLNNALIGYTDKKLIEAQCTIRPMGSGHRGPVMLVGLQWQSEASERHVQLANNAVERFELLHEAPRTKDETISLTYQSGIMTQDRAMEAIRRENARQSYASQGNGIGM